MCFGCIILGAADKKLLDPISAIQRKAVRLVARAPYNAHTDVLFKKYQFLKFDDIVQLSQCMFLRQYSNKQLPISFNHMFKYLPISLQVFRHQEYNFEPKIVNKSYLKHYPTVQLVRTWNSKNLFVKCEAEIQLIKETFKSQCISSYDDECLKLNCYVCNRT